MTTKYKVAVVNSKSFGKYTDAVQRLSKYCDVSFLELPKDIRGNELAKSLTGYQFVIASTTPKYTEDFFKNNLDVVMIVRHGLAVDNIDVEAAKKYGVGIARVPGWKERESVAEHAIALMLAALRKVANAYIAVKEGRWKDRAKFMGKELSNLTVGIIGFGNIGSRVAEILIKGFGAKVLAYSPHVPKERIKEVGAIPVSLDELLEKSDIISLHTALRPDTYHILNEERLSKVKPGVIIVNTGRGELIDTKALIKALESGRVSAAALDVVEGEPIDASHPLLKFENVIITPHIGAYTIESVKAMDEVAVNAIINFIKGEPVEGLLIPPKRSLQK